MFVSYIDASNEMFFVMLSFYFLFKKVKPITEVKQLKVCVCVGGGGLIVK